MEFKNIVTCVQIFTEGGVDFWTPEAWVRANERPRIKPKKGL